MDHLIQSRRSSVLAALVSQVQTLRICLIASGCVCVGLTVGLVTTALKKPLVIGLSEREPMVLAAVDDPSSLTIPEVRAFVYDLISKKFPKNPTKDNLLGVCRYFTEGPRAACEKELQIKKTFIPQDVVLDQMIWNERIEAAVVKLKRFATFSGSVSSVESALTLKLSKRSRTSENPWGIFVESWKEEVKK